MRKLLCVIVCLSMLAGLCACTHTAEVPETVPEISDEDLYTVDMEEKRGPSLTDPPPSSPITPLQRPVCWR